MDIIRFFISESPVAWRRVLMVAGLAGLCNAAIIGFINRGAALAANMTGLSGLRIVFMFGLCLAGLYAGKRFALIRCTLIVEHMLKDRLVRVTDGIRHSQLEIIEKLSKGELYTKIAQDINLISQSALVMVAAAQQSIVLVFCLLYVGYLSRPAFFTTLAAIGVGLLVYSQHSEIFQKALRLLVAKDAEVVDTLGHAIDGFKEVRMNHRKSDALLASLDRLAGEARDLRIRAQIMFCTDMMFSDTFFYSLLAIIVFLLPRFFPTSGPVVLMVTASVLFVIGPMAMIVQATPVFERAKSALASLQELEARLAEAARGTPAPATGDGPDFTGFGSLSLREASYTYGIRDRNGGFSVGPVDLRVERGETVFIVGGNGCGKTTLLKLLTGLYVPQAGGLYVDDLLLHYGNIDAYRDLFSTVFADFHLFDQLYGLEGVDDAAVAAVLSDLGLTGKTDFRDGRFTDLNLSTGQRKRLALAVCLLENRAIMVFDEWAADQDYHFRQRFYEVVLTDLKARGKTVIAVTHDDRFWGQADRVIKMEYGGIIDEVRSDA